MPTLTVTFVQATFVLATIVHIRNISVLTDLGHTFWTRFLGALVFLNLAFLTQTFFRPIKFFWTKIFWTKFFLTKIFFDPSCFGIKIFWSQNLSDLKNILIQFFETQIFFGQKIVLNPFFFTQNCLDTKCFLDQLFFLTKNISLVELILTNPI